MQRVLLLVPATSYRASDFLAAARWLGVEDVVGSNHRQVLEEFFRGRIMTLRFEPIEQSITEIPPYTEAAPVELRFYELTLG